MINRKNSLIALILLCMVLVFGALVSCDGDADLLLRYPELIAGIETSGTDTSETQRTFTVLGNWEAYPGVAFSTERNAGSISIEDGSYVGIMSVYPTNVNNSGAIVATYSTIRTQNGQNGGELVFEWDGEKWKVADSYRGKIDDLADGTVLHMNWLTVIPDVLISFYSNLDDSKTTGTDVQHISIPVSSDYTIPSALYNVNVKSYESFRPGYKFMGWTTKEDGGVTKYPVTGTGPDRYDVIKGVEFKSSTDLFAVWDNYTVDITFVSNENTDTISKATLAFETTSLDYDTTFTDEILVAPEREGYIFDGWWTDKDDGYHVATDTDHVNIENLIIDFHDGSTTPTSVLFAHWTPKKTKIKLKANHPADCKCAACDGAGGSVAEDGYIIYTYDSDVIEVEKELTSATGYAVKSFNTPTDQLVLNNFMRITSETSAEYASVTDAGKLVWSTTVTDFEFAAVWTPVDRLTVKFWRNWETTDTNLVESKSVILGETTTATDTNIYWEKVGYNLKGWSTCSDYETVSDTNLWFDFANTPIVEDTNLYAHWTPITYEITFICKSPVTIIGGTTPTPENIPANLIVKYDEEVYFDTIPTFGGYSFAGWSEDKFSNGSISYLPCTTYTNLTATDALVELYAVWEKNKSSATPATCEVRLILDTVDADGKTPLFAYLKDGDKYVRVTDPKPTFTVGKELQDDSQSPQNATYKELIKNEKLVLLDEYRKERFKDKKVIDGFYTQMKGGVKILNADLSINESALNYADTISEAYNYIGMRVVNMGTKEAEKEFFWRGAGQTLYAHWKYKD